MTQAFRYLEPEYADRMINLGEVRIGTLSSFKNLEKLADPLDGGVWQNTGEGSVEPGDTEGRAMLAAHGIVVRGNAPFDFANNTSVQLLRGAAMCFCDCADNEHLIGQGKSGIIAIDDLELFALTLSREVLPLRVSRGMLIDRVRYEPREFVGALDRKAPDPFIKRESFSPEREIRLFWDVDLPEPIVVTVPALIPLMRRLPD